MIPQTLRSYQAKALREILGSYKDGARRVLLIMPTGGGKTTAFGFYARGFPGRVVILVHRRELATQAANRLREFGVDFGYIMAGEPAKPYARVQIASVQTLIRRKAPPADLVIADEAHLSTAKTWSTILEKYPAAKILGCTATPWRLSGKPLIGAYDASVVGATPDELRQAGYLCPYNGFSYLTPDLSEVETVGGDYNEKQSSAAMRAPAIVDNVVEQWTKHASHLSTVVFAVTVDHSKELTEKFKAAGVKAEHLDGETTIEQRRAILQRVESGATRVLCNVGVAVEGLDIPRLKCCVLARPTKSLARAIQMMGRVRRPFEGLTARIHDHAFLIKQHGLPDDDRDYSLHAVREEDESDVPSLRECANCLALYRGPSCPACAHVNPRGEREIRTVDDAEMYGFASGAAAPPPVVARPSVRIDWRTKLNKAIEGVYAEWRTETVDSMRGPYQRKLYRLADKRRDLWIPGAAVLDRAMASIKFGAQLRITYLGEKHIGETGKTRKEFKVEREEG